jgi:hypothetical protein
MAEIMDGEFNFLNGTITVLSAPQITLDRLRTLQRIIRDSAHKTPEEVVDAVETEAPDLVSRLKPLLPTDSNKLAACLLVILAVIQSRIGVKELAVTEHPSTPRTAQIEQIIRTVIASEEPKSQQAPRPKPPTQRPNRQTRRYPPQPQ